jgi:hypothetical protein
LAFAVIPAAVGQSSVKIIVYELDARSRRKSELNIECWFPPLDALARCVRQSLLREPAAWHRFTQSQF